MGFFTFCGEEYMFNSRNISEWLDIPHQGYSDYVKRLWPSSVSKDEVHQRVGPDALSMGIVSRVLHRILCQDITPRMQKHDQLLIQDYMIMDKLIKEERVSLPRQILQHMGHVNTIPNHGLPYPGLVKRILQHFKLYKSENEKEASKELDAENCVRMGFKFDAQKGWTKEGTFEPTGKELVVLKDRAEVREILKAVANKIDTLSKKIEDMLKEVSTRLSKVENTADMSLGYNQKTKEAMSMVLAKVEEATNMSLEFNRRTREDMAELNKQLCHVGKEIIKDMNDVFFAASTCIEGRTVPPQP